MAVVMFVTAMLVMVMVVIIMLVAMLMAMVAVIVIATIVSGMIVATMAMGFVCVAVAGIGTAFRIERRFDLDHPRAQPLDHVFDDVVAANA
jgi:hypothetical protein